MPKNQQPLSKHSNPSITFVLASVLARIGDGTIFLFQLIIAGLLFVIALLAIPTHVAYSALKKWIAVCKERYTHVQTHIALLKKQPPKSTSKIHRELRPFPKLNVKKYIQQFAKKTVRPPQIPEIPVSPLIQSQWKGFAVGVVITILFVLFPYNAYLFVRSLPNPYLLTQQPPAVTTQIFDRDGRILFEIFGDQNRKPVPLAEIPDQVIHATIAIEDKEFYQHNGISLSGIVRAMRENILNKERQGGSTITQQLIKNTLLTPEVTLTRKIKEALLAFWTEQVFSKNEILEMYLNQVPYGGTAWGIEAAAQTYFGKSVHDLNLAESALLAGLPKAPTTYSPHGAHPEQAKIRQEEVLRRMVEDGYISESQAEEARNTSLSFRPPTTNIKAPHFVMYVKQLLVDKYGQRLVEQGGLRVTTTLDLDMQEFVENTVSQNITNLRRLNVGNGAALVTNPQTGEILAMVGSTNYFDIENDGNVNVALTLQQPGSSIKLVNYAAALENGFTAASIINDSPVAFRIPGQSDYAPVNYDSRFHGPVPLRIAFGSSYNIPAVRVLNKIGVPTMVEMGRRMGIDTWDDSSRFGLSLTLGGGEVTMLDMAEVFGTVAAGGIHTELNPIISVKDYNGKEYESRKVKKTRALSEGLAFILADILADNIARTPAFGPNSLLNIPDKRVSVKTGTTDEKRDNWTIGFTPSIVTTVWVGNNDNSPMHPYLTSGITGAAPIWHEVMRELLKDKPVESAPIPADVVQIPCYGRFEYFIAGTQPTNGCQPLPKPSPSPSPAN